MTLISLYTVLVAISIQQKKIKILNEMIIISKREVLNYRQRDSTNGKNIINFMINKDRQGKAQTGKENVSIINFMINKDRQGKAQTGKENISIVLLYDSSHI